MAKKIEEPEVKKECPSCGLGVSLDSKICEFCGWDFEEEDEWILQIEKLERELMLEKRKFEPGSVEQRIEATLYTPTPFKPSVTKTEKAPEQAPQKPAAAKQEQRQSPEAVSQKQRVVAAPKPKSTPVAETIEIDGMRIRSVRGGPEPGPRVAERQQSTVEGTEPAGKVRRVRAVKSGAASDASSEGAGDGKTRKIRVVRKVKQ
jgi:hypothetical protein